VEDFVRVRHLVAGGPEPIEPGGTWRGFYGDQVLQESAFLFERKTFSGRTELRLAA
jgi:hypothetical protein